MVVPFARCFDEICCRAITSLRSDLVTTHQTIDVQDIVLRIWELQSGYGEGICHRLKWDRRRVLALARPKRPHRRPPSGYEILIGKEHYTIPAFLGICWAINLAQGAGMDRITSDWLMLGLLEVEFYGNDPSDVELPSEIRILRSHLTSSCCGPASVDLRILSSDDPTPYPDDKLTYFICGYFPTRLSRIRRFVRSRLARLHGAFVRRSVNRNMPCSSLSGD